MVTLLAQGIKSGREWTAWFFLVLIVIAAILAFTTWWGHRKR
jgi:hypothetical protein